MARGSWIYEVLWVLVIGAYSLAVHHYEVNPCWPINATAVVVIAGLSIWRVRHRLRTGDAALEDFKINEDLTELREQVKRLDVDSPGLALFQNEYNKAADRYENIYRAVWQNFSYMAILAAGILTFGGKDLDRYVTVTVAWLPLAFWYLTTYVPMDHYGRQSRLYLTKMEGALFGREQGNFAGFLKTTPPWRVAPAVHTFAAVGSIVFFLALIEAIDRNLGQKAQPDGNSVEISLESDTVVIQAPQVDSLRLRLDDFERRIAEIGAAVQDVDSAVASGFRNIGQNFREIEQKTDTTAPLVQD